jgi:hypothetical protein
MRVNLLRKLLAAASLLIAPAIAQAQGMTPAPQSPQSPPAPPPAQQQPAPPPTQQPVSPTAQQPVPQPYPWQAATPWGAPHPLPPPPTPPASAVAPNGEYVAPLAQTTQPVYVPQSVAMSGPRFIKDWEPGQPIPYGYHAENRTRKGPIIAGTVLFCVAYGLSSFTASLGDNSSSSNPVSSLYIPVVGPFAQLFQTHSSATGDYMLIADGGAQAAGIILFIYGVTSPRPLLVRNDLAFTVAPMKMGRDGNGFGFVGRF